MWNMERLWQVLALLETQRASDAKDLYKSIRLELSTNPPESPTAGGWTEEQKALAVVALVGASALRSSTFRSDVRVIPSVSTNVSNLAIGHLKTIQRMASHRIRVSDSSSLKTDSVKALPVCEVVLSIACL